MLRPSWSTASVVTVVATLIQHQSRQNLYSLLQKQILEHNTLNTHSGTYLHLNPSQMPLEPLIIACSLPTSILRAPPLESGHESLHQQGSQDSAQSCSGNFLGSSPANSDLRTNSSTYSTPIIIRTAHIYTALYLYTVLCTLEHTTSNLYPFL